MFFSKQAQGAKKDIVLNIMKPEYSIKTLSERIQQAMGVQTKSKMNEG